MTSSDKKMVRIRFPKRSSRSGNRTPGASVTGSNVTNYTNRELALVFYLKDVSLPGFEPTASSLIGYMSTVSTPNELPS